MKTPLILAISVLVWFPGLSRAGEDKLQLDIETRKSSIPLLEEYIKEREARMTEIANDIIRLDKRLEGKLEKVVKKLASFKDSPKSGYRVSQVKMEAMEGLKRTIDEYQSKRAALITAIREGRSGVPKETLEQDAKHFDEHIEKRIEQILEISKSFTQNENVKKYERVTGTSDYWGWGDGGAERISEEWRQNRRDRTMDKKQRSEYITALQKEVERHKSLIAGMKDSLANRRMSEAERELMRSELNRHIAVLDTRQGQLEELTKVEKPRTSPLTRGAAQDLEQAFEDAAADMRQDLETVFLKYAALNKERRKVFELTKNLEARKKWIADYEAKEKE